jgi:5-(carboxyamino)imidazole ribonucleotide synthase
VKRVGMVGGGQLARMTHQAAIGIGVELHVLAESEDAPAVVAGARLCPGDPGDLDALRRLAESSDVVTFDHEGVPTEHLEALVRAGHALHPAPDAKALAQDKLRARRTLAEAGFPGPPFAEVTSTEEAERFAQEHGWPVVLKAQRGGYDGRGVHVAGDASEAARALDACGGAAVAEAHVDIAVEVAALVARRPSGEAVAYPVVLTVQQDGMCRELLSPARVDADVAAKAQALALEIAARIGATGLLAVELFLTRDGDLLVNELALRPHNSGHWTIEGATTSQFEQHLRAVLDWPLGATTPTAPAVATVNFVGRGAADPADRLPEALAVPGAHVHLYGKAPRDGRKLGHVTALGDDADAALAVAREAAARLEGA